MNKGAYLLILYLPEDKEIEIGSLGKIKFKKGFYIYVGSAMNSLTDRVKRHLKKEKKFHWHIDYFLEHTKILFVVLIPSEEKIECKIAQTIKGDKIKGFGCSDCKCESHLFYFENFDKLIENLNNILPKNISN